jgi:hypothetical protein
LSDSYSARVIETRSVVEVAGLIVSVALRVTPLRVALMVALVVEVTDVVLMLKVADDAPAGTVTLAGTEARALLLVRLTVVAAEAAALKVTLPWAVLPPVSEVGVSVKADSVIEPGGGGGGAGGGVTVSDTLRLPMRLLETLMVTLRDEVTLRVLTVKLTLVLPPRIVTLEGTVATEVLLLESENVRPLEGANAPDASVIVPCADVPPTTLEGETVKLP